MWDRLLAEIVNVCGTLACVASMRQYPSQQRGDEGMTTPTQDRERILRDIQGWPVEEQVALAQSILQRAAQMRQKQSPRVPSAALRGLLANGQPAPSDEDVARWLEEARLEKYGG